MEVMDMIQEILVFTTFFIAVGYLFTKFIYKPKFLAKKGKHSQNSCGVECGTCH